MKGKILIIGAGALGKCLAALLADHTDIFLYDRDGQTREALKKGWFTFKEKDRTQRVAVRGIASLKDFENQKIDLLIFATKVMDLKRAIKEASSLDPRCVFFPQNGFFDTAQAKHIFKKAQICRGVTTMACQEINPNQVRLYYRGHIYAGGQGAGMIARYFRRCQMNTKAYQNADGLVWSKLIFSAVMNPLPVLSARGYDLLRHDPGIWRLVQDAVNEGRATAKALGVRLAFDPMCLIRRVRQGDLKGIAHRGSILQDVLAGKPTELDAITGAVRQQARRIGLSTPALDLIFKRARLAGA